MWTFSTDKKTGVIVRDVTVNTKKGGDPIKIIQITDVHLNYCNEKDLLNPTLASSYQNRKWLRLEKEGEEVRKGRALRNLESCMAYINGESPDKLVITGDIFDYLSDGIAQLAERYIYEPYPTALACLGNHEAVQKMQGEVEESLTYEERISMLESYWHNDIYYVSEVLGDKVMLVVMDNSSVCKGYGAFSDGQVRRLSADLERAREQGLCVLLFYHIPLATENPEHTPAHAEPFVKGDAGTAAWDFSVKGINSTYEGASGEMYRLITSNADVIAAAFCGHKHNDFCLDIRAKTQDGSEAVIPQYVLIGTPYGTGNVLRITVN